MTQIINTNGGTDFSSVTPLIAVDVSGNYVQLAQVAVTAGVDSVNSQAGALTLQGAGQISISNVGATITVSGAYVAGPVTSTADAVAVYNGTTGKLIKDSAVTIAGNDISIAGDLLVGDGHGILSIAAGQNITIGASSGVSIGGGIAGITNSTTLDITESAGHDYLVNVGNTVNISPTNDFLVTAGDSINMTATAGNATISSYVGFLTLNAPSGVFIPNDKTLVLTSSGSNNWRVGVTNAGVLFTSAYP